MFMRLLPTELVHTVDVDTALHSTVIYPIERSDRELKGLQIPVDNGRTYYVEARADLGGDREIPDILKSGALVKRASTVNRANKSWIIDCTPETPTQNSGDSTLLPHRTYADRENELFISVWNERPDGVHVVVRRGAPSIAPPTVDDIMIQQRGNQLTLVALTTPGDERIPNEDLLFFWKLGARTAITTPDNFATGRRVQIPTPEDGVPIWLLVSDQRGGETWTQVWPESP
jgi:hypothetical protein